MNSFVRDGAVNRKRRARLSLTTRNTEPQRKKIHKADGGGAAPVPRDLEDSNPRMCGESSASQSTVVATEKESRYSNIEFIRAKAFLYLNYKKIGSHNINKLLKEHLKQFDENETQLKRTFEQCYDLTGSVETSKAMMKQLETDSCLRLGLGTHLSSEVSNSLPCKVAEKNVKIVKQTKNKKSMPNRLKKKIEKKIIQGFGKDHYKNDRKILFSKKINDYNKTPKTDYNSDTTIISDIELDEIKSFCRVTKAYRVSVTETNSLGESEVDEPITDDIVLRHSNLLSNLQLNTDANVQNAEGFALRTNIDFEAITFPKLIIDECSQIASETNTDIGEITVSRLIIDKSVQNTKDSPLKTNTDAEAITFPQLIIDKCSQIASETNTDIGEITVSRLVIDESMQNIKDSPLKTNTDAEAITFPQLIIDECSENDSDTSIDIGEITVPRLVIDESMQNIKDSPLKTNTDAEAITFPQLIIDECSENDSDTSIDIGEITVPRLVIDEDVENTKDSPLKTNTDVELITFPRLIIDECSENNSDTSIDIGEITVPRLVIDEGVQNTKDSPLKTNTDVEAITFPQLIIDECSENDSDTSIDIGEITVQRLVIDEDVQNTKDSPLKTNTDVEVITFPRLIIDECSEIDSDTSIDIGEITVPRLVRDEGVQNTKDSPLKTYTDVEAITFPQLIIDECSENDSDTSIDIGEITVPRLVIDEDVQNTKDSPLKTNTDVEVITFPRLIIDECSEIDSDTSIDIGEITVPRLVRDEGVQNTKDSPLKTNTDVEAITFPQLIIDECSENDSDTSIDIGEITVQRLVIDEGVQNTKDSPLKTNTDVEAITFPQLIIDECSQNANGIIKTGEIIDLTLEEYISTQDIDSSNINALKIDIDIADSKKPSEILDHTNIELKIRKLLNPDDEVFNNSMIKDLATYFLNNDFLSKVDALWKTTESKLVGELIIKLLNMFNGTKYNMALFTGCLICIFREIAQKSSIPRCQMKFKLIVLLDAIKKYIKFHDIELWRNWLLPSMFLDWCFIVACIFMNSNIEFKIDLNESVFRNATVYYKMVKQCQYLFINQDSKPSKSHKKTGIFELTRIDDLLEIDDLHAINDCIVIPDNISFNISSNEVGCKILETDYNCIDTINLTSPENIEEVCHAPAYPKISVRPEFMYSNSFIKKSNWFTGPVSEILKKWSTSMSYGSFESSTVQNNSTVVGNNEEPSSVKKRGSTTNKPTKNKKSKTGFESPRVFFTIANNPTEFDITYGSPSIPQIASSTEVPQMSGSSVVPQMSSSSAVSQANHQIMSSLGVPKTSSSSEIPQISSSSVAPQNFSSPAVSQHLGPYYNNFSSSYTGSKLPATQIPRNLSKYYNNIVPNVTQEPFGLESRQSISNITRSSNTRITNPPVDKNITSTQHSLYSNTQSSIHHQHSTTTNSQLPKAANTWPPNVYRNLCSGPSYSKSSTYHTGYINSDSSYPQSQYNHYIPPATLHPRHSNVLTYPYNYAPISNDLLTRSTAMVSSMNTYMEHQNYNYGNSCRSQNNFHNTDHNTQVSPDLPDARLPNMPNHQASNAIKKTCMAANCTKTSNLSCNTCMAAFYCCAQCQKSDWHYHQNKCHLSF